MATYKLYYFNGRGRAEPARLCFAAGGISYEDIRFTSEEWQQQKKEGLSPSGQLPMLEFNGKKLTESMAIMRFIAREAGLAPSDSFDVALCDMVVNMTDDLFSKLIKFLFIEKDEATKNKLMEEFKSTHVPNFITHATNVLKENKGGQGFFVGDKLTYADIIMFYLVDQVELLKSALADNSELKAHYDRVGNVPNIKKWLDTRPKTAM